jgi:ring-1,2-phenylacetyl-CoA epoxidase subunit PaaD
LVSPPADPVAAGVIDERFARGAARSALAGVLAQSERGVVRQVAALWSALEKVPDPELPIVSVVELGIVRSLEWSGGTLVVRITPTYSGCPATDVIARDIEVALQGAGVAEVRVETVLAPAWTTDWIAPAARAKLRAFGIAPPGAVARSRVDVAGISPLRKATPCCPRCDSRNTRLVSQFGSTACKALYACGDCAEPFDYLKPI